jgi:hypothetical protein
MKWKTRAATIAFSVTNPPRENEMQDRKLDDVVARIEHTRTGLACAMRGNTITEEQYTELVEEIHILLDMANSYAVSNQIPVAIPDGFAFAEPNIRSPV